MKRAWLVMVVLSGCFNPDALLPICGSVDAPGQRVQLLRAPLCDDIDVNRACDPDDLGPRAKGHRFVVPLSSPEPLIGVRLRAR